MSNLPEGSKPLLNTKTNEFIEGAGGVLASRRILAGEGLLKWAFREAPVNPADNGWRFLAEEDDDTYINTPGNLVVVDFNTVAAIEPAVISIYLLPIGSDLQLVEERTGRLVFYDNRTQQPLSE